MYARGCLGNWSLMPITERLTLVLLRVTFIFLMLGPKWLLKWMLLGKYIERAALILSLIQLLWYDFATWFNRLGRFYVDGLTLPWYGSDRSVTPYCPGSAFIKPDQPDPWIKDQLGKALLSTILPLQLQNFVSCGRDKPSHMTQNFVTVGQKLLTRKWFLLDP